MEDRMNLGMAIISGLRPRVVRWPGLSLPDGSEALVRWLAARYGATSFYTFRLGWGFRFMTHFSYD